MLPKKKKEKKVLQPTGVSKSVAHAVVCSPLPFNGSTDTFYSIIDKNKYYNPTLEKRPIRNLETETVRFIEWSRFQDQVYLC
jgi:hypothetical protein